MRNLLFIFTMMIISMIAMSVDAQQTKVSPLEQKANGLIGIINEPKDLDKFFSPDFLAQVPPAQFASVFNKLVADYGKAVKVTKIDPQNDYAGKILVSFEKNILAQLTMSVEEKEPHLINGLLFTGIETNSASFEDVIGEMKKLPGQTALTVTKLNGNNLEHLASYNTDKSLAIGSAFKLYILSELVRSINAGERKWSDVVELNQSSLPSGQMQNWAQGSPVTLNTLASMMISISDNTATDQLLTTLGREKIEKMMSAAGNSNPGLSIPLLKTVEMFKLKGAEKENYAQAYLAKDISGKRAMLAKEIAEFKKEDIDFNNFLKKPTYISQIEWFATTDDLARVMNWLRQNTEKSPADLARGVLTINKALTDPDAKNWKYVGFKGGSETGVISLTYLLQSKKGDWYVVSGVWNDTNSSVDSAIFAGMMQKTVSLLQEKTK